MGGGGGQRETSWVRRQKHSSSKQRNALGCLDYELPSRVCPKCFRGGPTAVSLHRHHQALQSHRGTLRLSCSMLGPPRRSWGHGWPWGLLREDTREIVRKGRDPACTPPRGLPQEEAPEAASPLPVQRPAPSVSPASAHPQAGDSRGGALVCVHAHGAPTQGTPRPVPEPALFSPRTGAAVAPRKTKRWPRRSDSLSSCALGTHVRRVPAPPGRNV